MVLFFVATISSPLDKLLTFVGFEVGDTDGVIVEGEFVVKISEGPMVVGTREGVLVVKGSFEGSDVIISVASVVGILVDVPVVKGAFEGSVV